MNYSKYNFKIATIEKTNTNLTKNKELVFRGQLPVKLYLRFFSVNCAFFSTHPISMRGMLPLLNMMVRYMYFPQKQCYKSILFRRNKDRNRHFWHFSATPKIDVPTQKLFGTKNEIGKSGIWGWRLAAFYLFNKVLRLL